MDKGVTEAGFGEVASCLCALWAVIFSRDYSHALPVKNNPDMQQFISPPESLKCNPGSMNEDQYIWTACESRMGG